MKITEKTCTKRVPNEICLTTLPPPMNENESVNDFDIYTPPPGEGMSIMNDADSK